MTPTFKVISCPACGRSLNHAALGYVKTARGDLDMDADEQVQGVVRLVFDQFDRLGTLQGVSRYLE